MKCRICMVFLLLIPLSVSAGDGGDKKKVPGILKPVMWVKTLIDSMAVATVDRSYIEQPKKAWAVEWRNEASGNLLKMTADFPLEQGSTGSLTTKNSNGFSASTGLWLGYRGYGLGLSKELTHGDGSTISFGAMGGSFGINLRINSYHNSEPQVRLKFSSAEKTLDEKEHAKLDDPIHVRSLFLDGYYMFNGKHFSYAAAYDQSLIQKRSAGSLMAGAMYYHSRVSFDDSSNWPLIAFMRGVGKFKFTQASVGIGYAYNWVPAKGWLISAQAMPMLQFYNRIKANSYSLKYHGIDFTKMLEDNFEEFIMEMDDNDYEGDDAGGYDDTDDDAGFSIAEKDEYKANNYIGFNFDARLAVIYNWSNFYIRVYGHYNRFRYSNDVGYGRMSEWRAYASLGLRF